MDIQNLTVSQKAVRLIYKGLRSNNSAQRDKEYGELLALFDADPAFRTQVDLHAAMLELSVVDVTLFQILLRPTTDTSIFRMSLASVRAPVNARNNGLFGLALVAVGAAFYPRSIDLAGTGAGIQMTAEQIEEILSELCERIAAKDEDDPLDAGPENVEAWRVIHAMARVSEGEGRAGFTNRTSIIRQAIKSLVEHNMLREDQAGTVVSYVPTERLRVQMREVMTNQVYENCIRLLGVQTKENVNV